MARKNSSVSLNQISRQVERAVTKLKRIQAKASAADKKALNLEINLLKAANNIVGFACSRGAKRMNAWPWPITRKR
jgi:hypothetical protein